MQILDKLKARMLDVQEKPVLDNAEPVASELSADDIVWVEDFLDGLSPEVAEACRRDTVRGVVRRGRGGREVSGG